MSSKTPESPRTALPSERRPLGWSATVAYTDEGRFVVIVLALRRRLPARLVPEDLVGNPFADNSSTCPIRWLWRCFFPTCGKERNDE
jgi:hypothetical protein